MKSIRTNEISFLSFLFIMYLVAAVSSQTLLDTVTVLIILFSVYLYQQKRRVVNIKKIGIEWAFIGYLIVVGLGYAVNGTQDAEWRKSILKFSWMILLYFLILAFQFIEVIPVVTLKYLSFLTIGPTIYSLVSYVRGYDLLTGRDNSRLTGLVNSSTYHAHGNAIIFIFLVGGLYFCYQKLTKNWKVFSIISTALLGLSIFLTFTRGIWISIFLSSCIVFLFLDFKKLIKMIFLALIVFFSLLTTWPKFQDRIKNSSSTTSNQQRVDLFNVNVEMWKEYPWFGIGYGENQRRNREYWDRPEWRKPVNYITSHAHNQFLNVLATTGVFGFIFFCSFYFYFFFQNLKLIRSTSRFKFPQKFAVLVICLWAQIEFFIGCWSDVSFEYAKIRALLIIIWALIAALQIKTDLVKENTI